MNDQKIIKKGRGRKQSIVSVDTVISTVARFDRIAPNIHIWLNVELDAGDCTREKVRLLTSTTALSRPASFSSRRLSIETWKLILSALVGVMVIFGEIGLGSTLIFSAGAA